MTAQTQAPRFETVRVRIPLALDQTRATVALELDHRQKGLLWYATYAVHFQGAYHFRNQTESDAVTFEFPLPASQAIYDDLVVTLNGAPVKYEPRGQAIVLDATVPKGATAALAVSYRSQGLDEWRYLRPRPGRGRGARLRPCHADQLRGHRLSA